jgi:hypothetical protein
MVSCSLLRSSLFAHYIVRLECSSVFRFNSMIKSVISTLRLCGTSYSVLINLHISLYMLVTFLILQLTVLHESSLRHDLNRQR